MFNCWLIVILIDLPNSLKLNQQDWLSKSPQELFMLIAKTAFTKAQKEPKEAGAILAGLKEAGFSEIAELIRTSLLYQLDLKQVMFNVSKLVDTPMDSEVRRSKFTLVWEETMTRLVNVTDRLTLTFQALITPLLELINKIPFLKTSQEQIEDTKKLREAVKSDDKEKIKFYGDKVLEKAETAYSIQSGLESIGVVKRETRYANAIREGVDDITSGNADKDTLSNVSVLLGIATKDEKAMKVLKDAIRFRANQKRFAFTEKQKQQHLQEDSMMEALYSELEAGGGNIPYFIDMWKNMIGMGTTHMQNLGAGYSQPNSKEVVVITARDETKNGVKFDVESSNDVKLINQ